MAVRVDEKENLSTLGEVLSRYSLEKKDLELKCPARVRLEIAEHLGDWKMAGRYLNIDPQKLDDIQVENHTEERRRVALLDAWDEKEGEGATYLKLAEAVHHRNRTDLVEKLCKKIRVKSGGAENDDKVYSNKSVRQRVQSLEVKMIKLSRQLRCELEEKITADDLLDELTFLPIELKREYQKSVKEEILTCGDTCRSVTQLIQLIVNQVCTFLDYKLLEHLVSKFASSQLKHDMANYVVDLNKFKKETTVAELIDHWDGIEDPSVNFTELRIHFGEDPTKCNLERLDRFRKRYCSRHKLSELVMVLIHLKPGSFIAFWQIPTALISDITESVIQIDDLFFGEEKILSISVAGKQIFPVSSDEDTGLAIKDLAGLTVVVEDQDSGGLSEGFARIQVEKYGSRSSIESGIESNTSIRGSLYSLSSLSSEVSTVTRLSADSGMWGSTASGSMYSIGSQLSKSSESQRPLKKLIRKLPPRKHNSQPKASSVISKAESRTILGGNMTWKEGERAPRIMWSFTNAVATHNNVVYICNDGHHAVYMYNVSCSAINWSQIPDCPYKNCSISVVDNRLTTIGGRSVLEPATNKLFSFTGEDGDKSWTEEFPPMPTKRWCSTALCTGTSLIVAGGVGEFVNCLTTVEVMNTETRQWSTAADLPLTMAGVISSILCGDQLFVICGHEVCKCPLTTLLQSCTSPSSHHASESPSHIKPSVLWNHIADLPVSDSSCVSLNGQLLAIGMRDYKHTTPVYMYNSVSNSWAIISHMSTKVSRLRCFATILPDNKLVVVGGVITDSVEIATFA